MFLFSLVYTSVEEILPRLTQLWSLSKKDDSKEGRLEAKAALSNIIQVMTALLDILNHGLPHV